MKLLGQVTGVAIYYATPGHDDWAGQLPTSGWILLAIADTAAQVPVGALANCLYRSPAGIGCAGQWASVLEDNFDMEIVLQALDREEQHQQPFEYDYAPVTTAEPNLAEALLYAITLAPNMAAEAIDMVVCLDFTQHQKPRLRKLLPLLAAGWLPPD